MTTTLTPPRPATAPGEVVLPDWLPAQPPSVEPGWKRRTACHADPNPDRWTDLPPLRAGRGINPAYDDHLADLNAVCAGCAYRAACAWESLTSDVDGVWAGLDEFDRADIRDLLNLPDPQSMSVLIIGEPETDETRERDSRRFTARWLIRRYGMTNAEIAHHLGVSAMTIGRILDDRDTARRTKTG